MLLKTFQISRSIPYYSKYLRSDYKANFKEALYNSTKNRKEWNTNDTKQIKTQMTMRLRD